MLLTTSVIVDYTASFVISHSRKWCFAHCSSFRRDTSLVASHGLHLEPFRCESQT